MKKSMLLFVLCVVLLAPFSAALAQEDVHRSPNCPYCGMDRGKFAHSRMLLTYEDGSVLGTCSLHCLAIDLAVNIDKTPKSIQVGDYAGKELIDAETAHWVIGGNKPGVMSKEAKWAFASREAAEAYVKENGGRLATFDEAMKAAYESMYADTNMIRERRKMKRMQQATGQPAKP